MELDAYCDNDIEKAVLGAVLLRPEAFGELKELIATDFASEKHRSLFSAYSYMWEHEIPLDLLTLRDQLQRQGDMKKVGADYPAQLVDETSTTAGLSYHVGQLLEARKTRDLLALASYARNSIKNQVPHDEIINNLKNSAILSAATELDYSQPIPVDASVWLLSEPNEPDQIISGIIDVRDKLAVIGSSKMRKTFFQLQLLLCVASGRTFLNWHVPEPRRVVHIQYEIQPNHYHRRLKKMCRAMGITSTDLGDRLHIINGRGSNLSGVEGIKKISQIVKNYNPELISFDPLYKVMAGAENAIEDGKIILTAFDELIERTGAAVAYVHHDAKGFAGDRDIRDRGAGSNVIGRDYDACITLTPHVSEGDAAVIETMIRNYRPQEPFSALWTEDEETGGYRFDVRREIAPTKKTSANGRAKDLPPLASYLPTALDLLSDGPIPIGAFMDALRAKTGLTFDRSKAFRSWATSGTDAVFDTIQRRGRGKNEKLIGTTADILKIRTLE
ncbi:hypothetical protein PITCH_A1150043 [uncultured Desulfobacterium sp.]|uniref:DNA helicase DnaB-like N-terminal domain-containing protein n=1 Tax=uncultured Desulfobacterium sp. TaxID=201089 RepID=A0A445MRC7_9BACT|nr:hypothetical protein PITCH_A1150043 [uncultured Desulfobacterium sp.]